MTTPFDQTRAERRFVRNKGVGACANASGVRDLASLALSAVAKDHGESDTVSSAMPTLPSPHVAAMARLMADDKSDEAEGLVADLLNSGVSVQDLCLSHFTPAARELGRLWACDRLPFTEVTMATARMQGMLRNLPGNTTSSLPHPDRGALFAAVPGETHTLGVLMAADHFRRLNWDVSVLVGLDHTTLMHQILADDRPILGLSCAGSHSFSALTRVIDEVRDRRPDVAIIVSGAVTQEAEALARLPECDGIVDDLETAEADLKAVLAKAQRQHLKVRQAVLG